LNAPLNLQGYFIPESVPVEHRWVVLNDGRKHQISILRLDSIHPVFGGNKTFKLYENVAHFYNGNFEGIASVGGQYSNHIAALAQVAKDFGIPAVAFIRGEMAANPTTTLRRAMENGMHIVYVTRDRYREIRKLENPLRDFAEYKNYFFIPEGASNQWGVSGCRNIMNFIPGDFTHILCAVGTGATLKGIAAQLQKHQQIIGVKVLEAQQDLFINQDLEPFHRERIFLSNAFTFGGYAKKNDVLDHFVKHWNENDPIQIEPIYTGRLFYAAHQLIEQNFFPEDSKILIIHSGGLQYLID
jgi:1-aminocyclopropane-1-carboxylate deaminase